jgi:NADH dehydrogenase FAD-containing subunit
MDNKKRVIIIGANFAGLTAALRLPNSYDVTVIDPVRDFEFLPNIHELVSSVKSPENLRLSRRRLLRRAGHRFVQEAVTEIAGAEGVVMTQSGERFPFDTCVVTVGGVNNTFGVEGADKFAMPFKSVDDCEAIGEKLRGLFERKHEVSIVIVGGGLEGVESLGEVLRRYRNRPGLKVHLVERNGGLAPNAPKAVGRDVQKICAAYPVQFYFGTSVTAVTETTVTLSSGEVLPSDIVLWTVGTAPNPLLADSGLTGEAGKWAPVNRTLQSRFFDNIFIAGDAAELPVPITKQAYHANAMGECAAENVERFLKGAPLKNFQPALEISLISFGDLNTYLVLGKIAVASTALSAGKELVYQLNMAQYDPPFNLTSFCDLQNRYWTGILKLAFPTLRSPLSLLRLGSVRLLR